MAKKKQIKHAAIVDRFASRLRELRNSRGMRQSDLAQAAKITTSYVGRLESGGAAPGIDLVARLAKALGTSVEHLVSGETTPDEESILRKRAKALFDDLLKSADRETLLMLCPLLARLGESPTRKR